MATDIIRILERLDSLDARTYTTERRVDKLAGRVANIEQPDPPSTDSKRGHPRSGVSRAAALVEATLPRFDSLLPEQQDEVVRELANRVGKKR